MLAASLFYNCITYFTYPVRTKKINGASGWFSVIPNFGITEMKEWEPIKTDYILSLSLSISISLETAQYLLHAPSLFGVLFFLSIQDYKMILNQLRLL